MVGWAEAYSPQSAVYSQQSAVYSLAAECAVMPLR